MEFNNSDVALHIANLKKNAVLIGVLYLLMAPFAYFSMIYVPTTLYVSDELAEIVANLQNNSMLLRGGMVSWLMSQIIFVFLVLYLYQLFSHVSKNLAIKMIALALLAVPIAFMNEINTLSIIQLLSGSTDLSGPAFEQLALNILFYRDLHTSGLNIAQIFWGLWLFPFGYLVVKSKFLPKFLGYLLMVGGFGYLLDSVSYFLAPTNSLSVSVVTGLGELIFPLWLLIKGINTNSLS